MRRLGHQPLTGAEKQKRHREKVKARLAEAETLKRSFADGGANALFYLPQRLDAVLAELGANAEERAALVGRFDDLDAEIFAVIWERAAEALSDLRSKGRRGRSSLLARLSPVKPGDS